MKAKTRHGMLAEPMTTMTFVIPKSVKKQLNDFAVKEHRTISSYVRLVLCRHALKSSAARRGVALAGGVA